MLVALLVVACTVVVVVVVARFWVGFATVVYPAAGLMIVPFVLVVAVVDRSCWRSGVATSTR